MKNPTRSTTARHHAAVGNVEARGMIPKQHKAQFDKWVAEGEVAKSKWKPKKRGAGK